MARGLEYKYIVAIVATFGLFMELLDATIVNVAIPTLAEEFGVAPNTIEWVVTGYLLAQAAGVALLGISLGALFILALATSLRLTVSSFTIAPGLNTATLLPSLAAVGVITLAGSLLPAWWLGHLNLAELLHSE